MKSFRLHLTSVFVLSFSLFSFGQDDLATYNLKKGEAFDILLISTKPNSKEAFKEYREKAFPVAVEMGYSFLPGFNISEILKGSLSPKGMIMGKWKSIALREKFLAEIDSRVPNFHEMRSQIWSFFTVTYYEVPTDISFQLDSKKVIVATAFWKKEKTPSKLDTYLTRFKSGVKKTGGTLKLELVQGKSPSGYYYNPDYMIIAQWDSREEFETFQKENLKIDGDFVKDINQFILSK
ncbi:hypothetical protein [Flagellimonas flava]|uniref:ABM domain-containing protein n=1 Tax=Flagellimonas flava TaxID=570519 RepID=A0A1M5LWM8_9FLAO|nr:hypothetical protein [Allomuricauda flava]SHG68773.1 hypothetical protein SAMN04488116_2099 [Allomuricauda flava]